MRPATIKDSACRLLCKFPRVENGQTIGYSYAEVLKMLRAIHPTARTSNGSLRWYATQIRQQAEGFEGYTLPDCRPRGGD